MAASKNGYLIEIIGQLNAPDKKGESVYISKLKRGVLTLKIWIKLRKLTVLRRSHILSLICVLGLVSVCLTNGFANDDVAILEGPPEFQRAPESIIGTADFEKMRDLPTNSQDYSLGTKVGLIAIPSRDDPDLFWTCTGFLVGPDLFMTTRRCIDDNLGLLPLEGTRIYMDYYQEPSVDRTRGGITAGVLELLRVDDRLDYALLRLDKPIGNTYGWLDLDSTTRVDTSQSVKLISHPDFRSKEIVRRNSQIVDIVQGIPPFWLTYLADTEDGSAGSPVFLREGTGVIGIHQSSLSSRGVPVANRGTLMSYIVPEIQQWLPGGSPPTLTATTLEVVSGDGQRARAGSEIANPLVVRVRDQNNAAMSGVSVSFSVTPSGTLNPSSATTGANGEAQTRLTLGSTAGTYTVTARATGITQPVTFTATATSLPRTPTPNDPISFDPSTVADQTFTVGEVVNLTLPVATGGTPPYTYTFSPIPPGLEFNAASRSLSGTPTTTGTTNATYTATDASRQTETLTFTITVTPAPITLNPSTIADQTFTVDKPVNLTLPTATGGTPPYTYTLSPIPPGLEFVAAMHSLAGIPTTVGITDVTYTATDATEDAAATLNFTIEVIVDPLDVNSDGQVTVIDLVIVALFYGTQVAAGVDLPADVNDDSSVDILDLTAVAQAIEVSAGNNSGPSADDVAAVLEAIAGIERIAEAPATLRFSRAGVAYRNVAAAFAAARHLATEDACLGKWMPILKGLLHHLLREMREIPDTTALLPNYPNPFNPETWIPYDLSKPADVTLTIYAVNGQVVRTLTLGHQPAGVYKSRGRAAYWDGKNQIGEPVASGLYFYRFTAGDFTATRRMLIAK